MAGWQTSKAESDSYRRREIVVCSGNRATTAPVSIVIIA